MAANIRRETAFGDLMRECFRTNRELIAAVARLTEGSGITGAQWGVLGAFGARPEPLTVAEAARRLGLTRQGVQRVADVLARKRLIEFRENPHDRRAKVAVVTEAGRSLLARLRAREARWSRDAARDLKIRDVKAATEVVRAIRERLVDSS